MDAVRKISRAYAKLLKNGRRDPDFFEFVRRVERAAGAGEVGRSADFQSEPMRFGQEPCLYRPATDIAEISERERLLVFVYFLGLCGTNGPLPLDLTNFVFQRAHNACDLAPRRFLDIFNHRFIGLFYRAWKMNEQAAQADAPGQPSPRTPPHAWPFVPGHRGPRTDTGGRGGQSQRTQRTQRGAGVARAGLDGRRGGTADCAD